MHPCIGCMDAFCIQFGMSASGMDRFAKCTVNIKGRELHFNNPLRQPPVVNRQSVLWEYILKLLAAKE